jgi:TusA-related sulfurtransferase
LDEDGMMADELKIAVKLDLKGLNCPLPIFKVNQAVKTVPVGEGVEALATDEGVQKDIPAWCKTSGHELVRMERVADGFCFVVRRVK